MDPALTTQAPKDAKYYGAHNSIAANPKPLEQDQPKVAGEQTKIVRVEDNPKPGPQPLQPTLTQPKPEVVAPQPKPAETQPKGDTVQTKPDAATVSVTMPEPKVEERPRTLQEARLRKGMLAGEKMRQNGGVRQRGRVSLNVKATPFGAYDAAFIAAVQQRWYELIDNTQVPQRSGKVALEFRLNIDGSITDMKVRETEVGEMLALLCQRAVKDPAPYLPWPSDMQRMVGKTYREVLFTFYYN